MKVETHPIDLSRNSKLKYAIIATRIQSGEWIFVRHKDRLTWEIPAGHIEKNEHPDDAAKRELYEETGALSYTIRPITDYSVTLNHIQTFGRIYLAQVEKLGDLPESEIGEIMFSNSLPGNPTYPDIQPKLFEFILQGNL